MDFIFVKKYAKENSRTEDVCVTETDDRKSFFVSEMPGFVNYWFEADKMEL